MNDDNMEETEEMTDCGDCGASVPLYSVEWSDFVGDDICEECQRNYAECGQCSGTVPVSSLTIRGRWEQYCEHCTADCQECGGTYPTYDMRHGSDVENGYWDGHYCTDCTYYCDSCDTYEIGDGYDNRCGEYGYGEFIEHYGHTSPTMWLGGSGAPYYLGLELEISAEMPTSARPVKEWAEEHLGHFDAIVCKEDSSVEGFEIVTQPMTPEFFELVDWSSFFEMLNTHYPLYGGDNEPVNSHGLHVHISWSAFSTLTARAAYAYLMARSNGHLSRISRRSRSTGAYNQETLKPVSEVIRQHLPVERRRVYDSIRETYRYNPQWDRARRNYVTRGEVNIMNEATVEIRAAGSTRVTREFLDSVRVAYLGADYVRSIHAETRAAGLSLAKRANWDAFAQWTQTNSPENYGMVAGL